MRPLTVTRMPLPTELVAKVPWAEPVWRFTVSPATTPTRDAEPRLRIAVVEASYSLFAAVMPETVRGFAAIVWEMAVEVLPKKLLSPPYIAVTECGEPATDSVLVVKVAVPGVAPFNVPVPNVVAPSLKVTVPDGGPPVVGVTVAVNVTEFPYTDEVADEVRTIDVAV